jgi:hypothetical protein
MSIYQPSFFDEADRLATLTKLKDPLEALKLHIDFEILRPQLETVFSKDRKSAAGRKAYDVVLMFKILILQRLYNLSDEQAEFQINDRHSLGARRAQNLAKRGAKLGVAIVQQIATAVQKTVASPSSGFAPSASSIQVAPTPILPGKLQHQFFDLRRRRRRPTEDRSFDPSNFMAMSLRYQPRMVSGRTI